MCNEPSSGPRWALLYMASGRINGPAVIFNGYVQALRSGVATCIGPKHNEADWWMRILEILHEIREVKWNLQVKWLIDHTTEKQRKNMTKHERYVTFGNDQADELAKKSA